MLTSDIIETPLGPMTAIVNERGLVLCEFGDCLAQRGQVERVQKLFGETPRTGAHVFLDQTRDELGGYFAGKRETFTIPLVVAGTPFQEQVWRELLRIPFGRTASYNEIGSRIGRAGAARAVGRANGDNRTATALSSAPPGVKGMSAAMARSRAASAGPTATTAWRSSSRAIG